MAGALIRRWKFEYASELTLNLANLPSRVRIPNTGRANPVTMAFHGSRVVAQWGPGGDSGAPVGSTLRSPSANRSICGNPIVAGGRGNPSSTA